MAAGVSDAAAQGQAVAPAGARGYSWPPFEPGNEAATKHGAYSIRRRTPLAELLVESVLSTAELSYLHAPAYRSALVAWAMVEAQVALIGEWVQAMPIEKAADAGPGRVPPLEILRKWDSSAMRHRARLGLDPLSRARLGRDVAATKIDVAAVMAEMHRQEQAAGEVSR